MRNFFDEARAEDSRSKIFTFTHEPTESFKSSWIRFKSYQRDCPHHGFNEVQLLNTFFRGITLAYQMVLYSASDRKFHPRNPEEADRLLENLTSCSSRMDTDFKRRESAADLWKEVMDDVKVKMDSVYRLLKIRTAYKGIQRHQTLEAA